MPWDHYERFLLLAADSPVRPLLHEACHSDHNRPRRPNLDVDGTLLSAETVARQYAAYFEGKTRVAIKLCNPSTKDAPGLQRFHLIAMDIVLSGTRANDAHRWHFDRKMRELHGGSEGCLDMAPMDLRMLGSDKAVDGVGSFAGRPLIWGGVYNPFTNQIENLATPLERYIACSIHYFCGNNTTVEEDRFLFTPEYKQQEAAASRVDEGEPYDDTNPIHRGINDEVQSILGHYPACKQVQVIASIARTDKGGWLVFFRTNFCLTLNRMIYDGKKSAEGRASEFEHHNHTGGFLFGPDHITSICNDGDCKRFNAPRTQLPYSSPAVKAALFGPVAEAVVEEGHEEVDVDVDEYRTPPRNSALCNYIVQQECPLDKRLHYDETTRVMRFPNGGRVRLYNDLHAYAKDGLLIKVPHGIYTGDPSADALIFHACAPPDTISYRTGGIFTLRDHVHCQKAMEYHLTPSPRYFCTTCSASIPAPPLSEAQRDTLHVAHHLRRRWSAFSKVPAQNARFGKSVRLWDYDLSRPLTKRETWYSFSGKGTGKTHQNRRVVGTGPADQPRINKDGNLVWNGDEKGSRPAKVLILSPLIAVAGFYAQTNVYNAANYDNERFRTHPGALAQELRAVCSLESLHLQLPADYVPDIVVMDESEWLLQIFSNKQTMNDCRQLCWARFCFIMRRAKLVIASDSRLGKKTYDVLNTLRGDGVERLFYNYQSENSNTYTQYESEEIWYDTLEQAIEANDGPIFLPTNSVGHAERLRVFILNKNPDASILFISGETYHTDPTVRHAVDHCKDEWIKYRYVIITPVVGPAVDFSVEYFRYCFAWATPRSGTPAQFFQMIGRVRFLLGSHVAYFVNRVPYAKEPMDEERLRSHILRSAKLTARLGINLTENLMWSALEKAYENGVYDQLFFNLHLANLYEEHLGKARFARELTKLITEQQSVAPIVCTDMGTIEQAEALANQRNLCSKEMRDSAWVDFNAAPDLNKTEAEEIQKELRRRDGSQDPFIKAYEKFVFRQVYGLSTDHKITRAEFDQDNPERRLSLWTHEDTIKRPQVKQLLTDVDEQSMKDVAGRKRTMADINLQALPRRHMERVFSVFGFPPNACVAQCMYSLTQIHPVTPDYCHRMRVMEQIRLLRLEGGEEPRQKKAKGKRSKEGADGIRWFRKFIQDHLAVEFKSGTRIKKRLADSYHIDPSATSEIVKRRNPGYNMVPPPVNVIEGRMAMPPLMGEWELVWITFVLAFSPLHLAALHTPCILVRNSFVPTHVPGGPFSTQQFTSLCKKHCPNGLLLSFSNRVHLYYQYEQYMALFPDGHFVQCATAADVVAHVPAADDGTLWLAPHDRPDLIVREHPSYDIVYDWAARFVGAYSAN